MNKIISAIQRQLGVIEGAMAGAPQSVADVIFAALGMIGEHMETVEQIISENAHLSRINTELETQMRRMVANQCKCDCDWMQEDETA